MVYIKEKSVKFCGRRLALFFVVHSTPSGVLMARAYPSSDSASEYADGVRQGLENWF